MRFLENARNTPGKRAVSESGGEIEFGGLGGGFTRKPMVGLAEQILSLIHI